MKYACLFCLSLLPVTAVCAKETTKTSTYANNAAAVGKWRSYGYGMFIHFGMNTFTRSEYEPGAVPSTTYAPDALDVDQWVRVAKEAGMKYAVLTTKHTSGHCLWDSKVQWRGKEYDYDVATSGNKTDVVAAFVAACKKYGIAPGIYWCMYDARNNSLPAQSQWKAGGLPEDFFQLAQDQLSELTRLYPDVAYYWIDITRAASRPQREKLREVIIGSRPNAVVLFNNGPTNEGQVSIAQFQDALPTDILNSEERTIPKPGEFSPEQQWEGKRYYMGYEHCDKICGYWFGYEGDKPRSTMFLWNLYRKSRAAGANLLLNVPPNRNGRIPDDHVKALMDLKKSIDAGEVQVPGLLVPSGATSSNVYQNLDDTYGPKAAIDKDSDTRWATDNGLKSAWLELDFGKPVTFSRVLIESTYAQRVKAFSLQYRDGDTWKAFHQGKDLSGEWKASFEPISAQRVRLNLTETTDGPTISEFQIFEK